MDWIKLEFIFKEMNSVSPDFQYYVLLSDVFYYESENLVATYLMWNENICSPRTPTNSTTFCFR